MTILEQERAKARRIWRALFHKPFPRGWTVTFGYDGVIVYPAKTIYIASPFCHRSLPALIHEFVHLRWRKLPHGPVFERRAARLLRIARKAQKRDA